MGGGGELRDIPVQPVLGVCVIEPKDHPLLFIRFKPRNLEVFSR